MRKFWSQFRTWKSYKLAVYSDGKLVSLKVLFPVRHVSAARLIIFRSSALLFSQVSLLAQKAQLAVVTYRWRDHLQTRKFWFAGIEWMIRVHILHAHVRACYTFYRHVTARGFELTDRHTISDGTWAPVDISVFWSGIVPVKLLCNYWCQSFLQAVNILPLTFIEKAIRYETVPLNSDPSQLLSPETVTSKFQLYLHQHFICRNRQQPQDTTLGYRIPYWMFRGKWPTWHTILFCVFIFIFSSLHVSSTSCSSSGERNCVSTTSGNCHCVYCQWPSRVQFGSSLPTCTRHGVTVTRGCIDTICPPDDEHDVLETCRELKIKINT